jgi:hypothetical protein
MSEEYSNGYARGYEAGQESMLKLAEQPAQQEPAGSVYRYGKDSSGTPWHGIRWTASGLDLPDGTLIYTSPPSQRTWQGLADAETEHLWEISRAAMPRYHTFKTLIEKALRERNT